MANKPKQSSKKQLKNTKNKKKLTVIFLVDAWFPFIGGGQVYARELKHSLEIFFNCTVRLYYPPRPHILVRAFWSLYVPFQILIDSLTSKVNVIHSQGYNSGLAGMLSAWLIKVPIVHTVHGSNLLDLGSSSIKTLMERILLTRLPYNAQISVTRSFLKYKNNAKKVIYIPNGVDVQAFDEVQTKKSSSPRVLWVGRDDFVKGYDVFCDAVKIIRKEIPDVLIDAVINGDLTHDQLANKYKKAHVFVISSRSEGFPLTLLEACASKTPVVATSVGEIPSIIKNRETGLLVEPENPHALGAAVVELLSNKNLSNKLAKRGYTLVNKNYSWDTVAKETRHVYEGIT